MLNLQKGAVIVGFSWLLLSSQSAWAQTDTQSPTTPSSPAPAATPAPAAVPAKPAKAGGPVVVGVIDIQTLLQQSTVGKSLASQADQKRKAIQADITKQEQALRAQQQQLLAQRASLPKADFDKKEKDIQDAFNKLRTDTDAKRKQFEDSYAKALQQIYTSLSKILSDIAQQRGMNLILNKANIVLSDSSWDITDEVLKKLNASLASVKMQ